MNWDKAYYENCVFKFNQASMMGMASFTVEGNTYNTENAKYMLALFGDKFGYDAVLKGKYILIKNKNN